MKRTVLSFRDRISLLFTVAVIFVSVCSIGFWAYRQLLEQRRVMAQETNAHISSQVGTAMELWLDGQVQLASSLASVPILRIYSERPEDLLLRKRAQAFLEQAHHRLPHFTLITLLYFLPDTTPLTLELDGKAQLIDNGCSLVDSIGGRSVGVGGLNFSYIKAMAEGSRAFVSEAKPNALPGLPPIYMVTVPILNAEGKLVAALGFGVKLEYFSSHFVSNFHLGATGRIELIDDRGMIVGSPDESRVLNEAVLPEGRTVLGHLASGKDKAFTVQLPEGRFDYSATPVRSPYDMANAWWVLFRRASHELHDELSGTRNWLIVFCLAASAFMSAMAVRGSLATAGEAAERTRRKESELKKVYVDAAPYAIMLVAADGRLVDANPAASRIFGYSPDELIGQRLEDLIGVQESSDSLSLYEGRSGQCAGRSKAGKALCFAFDACQLEGGRHLVFFRDETELAAQQQKAQALAEDLSRSLDESERLRLEAERATNVKSEFLANMSHEIRTPLNAIIGMAHLLLQNELNGKLRRYAETISNAGKTLLGLINSVLDLSKIEAGKMTLEAVPFNLDAVLQHIGALFRQPMADKGLMFAIDCAEDVPRLLMGDALRLEQVINNLLGNAVKFTAEGSVRLTVALAEPLTEPLTEAGPTQNPAQATALLRFAITDTGIGMSEEESARLFKAFTQADTSTTRKYGGTGLGLVISKLLVELMGGGIDLHSKPGQGTTFVFTARFGLASGEAALAHMSEDGTARSYEHLRGRRILLVEDNIINQEVALELLRGVQVSVEVADNGQIAVERLARPDHGFELVLMDVQMPVMDGHAATRRIREYEHNCALPIIAMTAHAMSSERERCLESGMNDHISKPIEVSLLYAALARWMPQAAFGTRAAGSVCTSAAGSFWNKRRRRLLEQAPQAACEFVFGESGGVRRYAKGLRVAAGQGTARERQGWLLPPAGPVGALRRIAATL